MTQESSGYPDQGPPPTNPYGQPGQPEQPGNYSQPEQYGQPPQTGDQYGAPQYGAPQYAAPQQYGQQGQGQTFFVSMMGAEQGPYDFGSLSQMAIHKQIKSDAMIRTSEGQQWFPAAQVPGLYSQKEWLTTALLSWFLGSFGVDRFYLGYTGLGIAKLLTCGGLGIWHIIDFVLVILRKVPDSDGRPLR